MMPTLGGPFGDWELRHRLRERPWGSLWLASSRTGELAWVHRIPMPANRSCLFRLAELVERLRTLHHPGLQRLIGVERDGIGAAVLGEHIEGEFLDLAPTDALSLGRSAIDEHFELLREALGALHQVGLAHGDVAPWNVFLSPSGPKLVDAGLALSIFPSELDLEAPQKSRTRSARQPPRRSALRGTPVPSGLQETSSGSHEVRFAQVSDLERLALMREALSAAATSARTPTRRTRALGTTRPARLEPCDSKVEKVQLAEQVERVGRVGPADTPLPHDLPFSPDSPAPTPCDAPTATPRETPTPRRPGRSTKIALALAMTCIGVGSLILLVALHGAGGARHRMPERLAHDASQRSSAHSCGPRAIGPLSRRATELAIPRAIPLGTPCRHLLSSWGKGVLSVTEIGSSKHPSTTTRKYSLGAASDQVLVGEWDCSAVPQVAVYVPGSGRVYYFGSWPATGGTTRPVRSEAAARGGRAAVAITDGCPVVKVLPGPSKTS